MALLPKYEKALEVHQNDERDALERVCNGGEEAGIAFFTKHPNLGFAVAVSAQLEADGLRRSLTIASADVERLRDVGKESAFWLQQLVDDPDWPGHQQIACDRDLYELQEALAQVEGKG